MKRLIVLSGLVIAGGLSIAVAAQQQPPPPPHVDNLTVEKVKDNLFVIRGNGSGGNVAVFVTASGVTLVDSKSPGWGQPLLDKVKTVTSKPVTTLINTHTHYDHVSGNVALPATVEIIAHENTATLMRQMNPPAGIGETPNVFKENPGKGMPKRTFKDKLSIGSGADQINLYYFGPAHTGGDAFIEFPAHRIMHVGDTFPNKGLPLMDGANGGAGVEYPNTILKAVNGVKNIEWIINGHTPAQTTPAEMREFAEFVREFVTHAQAGKKAGKTPEVVAKEWVTPTKYKGYAAATYSERMKTYVELIYRETK
jgi:cyclase